MNECINAWKERKRNEMLSHGGGSGGGRIEPSVAAQSKYYGLSWNPPSMTSFLFTELQPISE